jgi:hypothetical protein
MKKTNVFRRGWLAVALLACVTAQLRAEDQDCSKDPSPVLCKMGFGVALMFRANVFGTDLVDDATVDANGFVRVNSRSNTSANIGLEMHYFPWQGKPKGMKGWLGTGPFVAVQPGSDQIITALGGGWMIGFKANQDDRKGFGLGFGYAAIPSAKTLGDEFVNKELAPKGPDGKFLPIRFEQRDKGSILVIASFVF